MLNLILDILISFCTLVIYAVGVLFLSIVFLVITLIIIGKIIEFKIYSTIKRWRTQTPLFTKKKIIIEDEDYLEQIKREVLNNNEFTIKLYPL